MNIKINELGKRIFDQENGSEIGKKIIDYHRNGNSVILDFDEVLSVNITFFNAIISKVVKESGDSESYSKYFKIKNANDSILSIFALTMQYAKYFSPDEDEDDNE